MTDNAPDPWESGEAYERFMGRWSRAIACDFLHWLAAPEHLSWADVGSGTGAFTQSILDLSSPASVMGIEPSQSFLDFARRNVIDPRARFLIGNAASLPLPKSSVDVLVSGFVLNFVLDPEDALQEMIRVVRPSGTVAAVVWDYLDGMEFLRHFWTAAAQLDPDARHLDEGTRFPICRPEPLRNLFATAGLVEVRIEAIEVETHFAGFMDYWKPFLGGTGPAPGYLNALSKDRQEALRVSLEKRLPTDSDGTIVLTARGWGVAGNVAA
jgi:SAM-dependent methyltransferase